MKNTCKQGHSLLTLNYEDNAVPHNLWGVTEMNMLDHSLSNEKATYTEPNLIFSVIGHTHQNHLSDYVSIKSFPPAHNWKIKLMNGTSSSQCCYNLWALWEQSAHPLLAESKIYHTERHFDWHLTTNMSVSTHPSS